MTETMQTFLQEVDRLTESDPAEADLVLKKLSGHIEHFRARANVALAEMRRRHGTIDSLDTLLFWRSKGYGVRTWHEWVEAGKAEIAGRGLTYPDGGGLLQLIDDDLWEAAVAGEYLDKNGEILERGFRVLGGLEDA